MSPTRLSIHTARSRGSKFAAFVFSKLVRSPKEAARANEAATLWNLVPLDVAELDPGTRLYDVTICHKGVNSRHELRDLEEVQALTEAVIASKADRNAAKLREFLANGGDRLSASSAVYDYKISVTLAAIA